LWESQGVGYWELAWATPVVASGDLGPFPTIA
jgi:hypothetical protein